jgi:hypothetical protein
MQSKPSQPVASDRRNFLRTVGLAGAGLASAAAVTFVSGEQKVSAAAFSDVDILNFALNLEYLGAEFYAVSTYGATLVQLGVISSSDTTGPTTGGHRIPNFGSYPEAVIATGLRNDEIAHVKLLRSILGSAAAKKPAINLSAKGAITSVNLWLALARQIEEVDMSAYLGAAPLLNSSSHLMTAASILATEAQHEGALRLSAIKNAVNSPALDAKDVKPTPTTPFAVNSKGLSLPRTFAEVLNIVYAGGNCSGGFFPNGLNGQIVCKSSA